MWQSFLLSFIEWVASKGAAVVWQEISDAISRHKANEQLKKNQDALQKSIELGNKNEIEKSSENSLNNSGN